MFIEVGPNSDLLNEQELGQHLIFRMMRNWKVEKNFREKKITVASLSIVDSRLCKNKIKHLLPNTYLNLCYSVLSKAGRKHNLGHLTNVYLSNNKTDKC